MILHHVAQSAGVFIISRPALDPDRFGDRDLDMIDVSGIPQGLEQRIGKSQRHQILHCLLAKIMIDAENALFWKDRANRIIDERRRTAVFADRFFDDDAGRGRNERMRGKFLGDHTKMIGSRRKVERAHALRIFLKLMLQTIPAQIAVDVEHDIMDHLEKALDRFVGRCAASELLESLGYGSSVGGGIEVVARHPDDLGWLRKLSVKKTMIKGREKLAVGEVTGATEDHQIKGSDLNDARNHHIPLRFCL